MNTETNNKVILDDYTQKFYARRNKKIVAFYFTKLIFGIQNDYDYHNSPRCRCQIAYADGNKENRDRMPDFYLSIEDAKNDNRVPEIRYNDFLPLFPIIAKMNTHSNGHMAITAYVWDGFRPVLKEVPAEIDRETVEFDALTREWHYSQCYKTAEECEADNKLVIIDFLENKEQRPIEGVPNLELYRKKKAEHPDSLLLIRSSNYYSALFKDADAVADVCGTTVVIGNDTDYNDEPVKITSFLAESLDFYLPMLIRAGHQVAIYEE